MKNLENVVGLQEMSREELQKTEGGLFPLIILGVTITAKTAAWIAAGATAAGVFGVGAYVGYQSAAN